MLFSGQIFFLPPSRMLSRTSMVISAVLPFACNWFCAFLSLTGDCILVLFLSTCFLNQSVVAVVYGFFRLLVHFILLMVILSQWVLS